MQGAMSVAGTSAIPYYYWCKRVEDRRRRREEEGISTDVRDAIADWGQCAFSGDTCQMQGLVNFSFMSNVLGLPPLVVLLQSSFLTESMGMGMGMSSEN
jgi:hypothetical protein